MTQITHPPTGITQMPSALFSFDLRKVLFSLLVLLPLLSGPVFAAEFSAAVNRYVLEEGESLELRLKVDESSLLSEPDYSPLELDFDIVNVSRSSQVQIINGDTQSSTIWKLALIPKRTGEIIIPPVKLNALRTKAITINVSKLSAQQNSVLQSRPQQIFVEAVVNKTDVYVQEQIIYTVRLLFQGIQIRKWNLSEPSADNAIIHPLGEPAQYDKSINGITYGVLEKRYAIFAQSNGSLTISPITFAGVITDSSRRQYMGRGQQVIKRSPSVALTVQPKNTAFKGLNWLPAKAVLLEEQWAPALSTLKVGESTTWTLVLKALGQDSSTLPPLSIPLPLGFKSYPDQADLKEGQNADGLIGQRTESIAIIATKPGIFTLPAVEVPWWDTENDQLRVTRIPERNITVVAAAPEITPDTASPTTHATSPTLLPPTEVPISDPELIKELRQWKIGALVVAAALILLLLINLFFWFQKRRAQPEAPSESTLSKNALLQQTKAHRKTLLTACQNNQAKQAQAALLLWASSAFDCPMQSIGQVRQKVSSHELNAELGILESLLYSAESDAASWNGAQLAELIERYEPAQPAHSNGNESLAPLHPIH